MKTKLLLATALTAALGTGLYASCNGQSQGMMKKGMNNSDQSCGKHMMMKKGHMKGQKGPMSLLRQLDLTADQQQQIKQIKQDLMKDRVTPNIAFTSNSFDKAKFIEIIKQKRDSKIEKKAEMMDRVYKVLTPSQKEQFKVLMDAKVEKRMSMINNRMSSNKNCNNK